MTLLDLSAPFLLRGRRRYYGSVCGPLAPSCGRTGVLLRLAALISTFLQSRSVSAAVERLHMRFRCRSCSHVVMRDPSPAGVEPLDERRVAEGEGGARGGLAQPSCFRLPEQTSLSWPLFLQHSALS